MSHISRRSFARNAVVIATAAAVLPEALAQTTPPTPPPALPAASKAEVEARVNWIFTKYGARLDDAQRADIRRIITGGQGGVDAMRAFLLDNGDDPALVFRVNPRGGKR